MTPAEFEQVADKLAELEDFLKGQARLARGCERCYQREADELRKKLAEAERP